MMPGERTQDMTCNPLSRLVRHLHHVARPETGVSDGQLLTTYIEQLDDAAFSALVRLHGPMVLQVCRRVLGNVHDAEDAFQAVFLVLARKADSIRPRELVGNWLYGVAYRTALEARTNILRRGARERAVQHLPELAVAPAESSPELRAVLDKALHSLPDKFRVPVVLCELEGRSRKDVAQQLNIPEGTLSSRLATARKLLAEQFARRGMALSVGALASVLAQQAAQACVPAPLVVSTVKAATWFAAGEATAVGLLSAEAAALAKGVMRVMFLSQLKIRAGVLLAVCLFVSGAGLLVHQTFAAGNDDLARTAVTAQADNAFQDAKVPPQPKKDGDVPKEGKKPRDGEKPPVQGKGKGEAVTLTGIVSKTEMKRKRDDGTEFNVTTYILTEAKGNKVPLPAPRISESGKNLDNFNLADFVGKNVTLTGRGLVVQSTDTAGGAPVQRVTKVLVITEIKSAK
jgi:RNA polymerase sigma factor (sigma-70 family)